MKRPWWVTDEPAWDALCSEIVRVAEGVLHGGIGVVEGARRLAGLSHEARADDDPDFRAFIGIASESDGFPLGDVRAGWDAVALAERDREREAVEAHVRDMALEAAARLRAKYGPLSGGGGSRPRAA